MIPSPHLLKATTPFLARGCLLNRSFDFISSVKVFAALISTVTNNIDYFYFTASIFWPHVAVGDISIFLFYGTFQNKLQCMWLCISLSFEIDQVQKCKRNLAKSAAFFLVTDGIFKKTNKKPQLTPRPIILSISQCGIIISILQIGKLRHSC